jgi:DNA-binding SARP family transcriptional activator
METLDQEHITSLRVLGFLYLRLGFADRAARLFLALLALHPTDAEAGLSLAAALLEHGKAEAALDILTRLEEPSSPATDSGYSANPVFLLLKARALWRLQRNEEAFLVMDHYLAAAGEAR